MGKELGTINTKPWSQALLILCCLWVSSLTNLLCLLHFPHISSSPSAYATLIFCRGLFLLLLLTSCILFPLDLLNSVCTLCNWQSAMPAVKLSFTLEPLWLQDPPCVSETHHHNPPLFVWCCSCWNEWVYWHHNHHCVGWCCCILLKQMGPGNHHHLCACWCCYNLQRQMGPGMLAPSTTELLLVMTMLRFVQDFFDL